MVRFEVSVRRYAAAVALLAASVALGCEAPVDAPEPQAEAASSQVRSADLPFGQLPDVAKVPAPLPGGHCDVNVTGTGIVDLEAEYLPNVIRCENGGANIEALKAQAIAARSVAYYAIETSGEICDSQGCQVFSCGGSAEPGDINYQAVEETSGVYLMFNSTLTYGFYVAGDNNTAPAACVGVSGSTEQWVTYNEGQTNTDVEQTELGFVHDPADGGYGQNRGCMSQWGARCLENNNDYDYLDILRFYYGEDIELVQATGECINPVDPTTTSSDGSSGGESGDSASATTGGVDPTLTSGPSGETEAGSDPATGPEEGGDEGFGSSDGGGEEGEAGSDAVSEAGSASGSDGTPGSGTGAVSDGALPGNFGGGGGDDGCGCDAQRGGEGLPAFAWLGLLLIVSRPRRRD